MIDGYLSSSFDLLNVSDLDVIAQASSRCDRLVVGVFSDEYVERTAGRKPVVPLEERTALMRHVRGVDDVVVHDDVDLRRFDADAVIFAVAGVDYDDLDLGRVTWIRSARPTASAAVRQSLASAAIPTAIRPSLEQSAVA